MPSRREVLITSAAAALTVGCDEMVSAASRSLGADLPERLRPTGGPRITDARHLLNRAAFGPWPGDVERVQRMGTEAWIDEQLSPAEIGDAACDVRAELIDVANIPADLVFELRPEHVERQLVTHTLLRAVYSQRQLLEVLVSFFVDHFNVHIGKSLCRHLTVLHVRDVLRPRVLGRFRDLLGAVVLSPAMLVYLDGRENTRGGPNENYARELLELHALGVHGGYTQEDVMETARCLTGWTVRETGAPGSVRLDADGFFAFHPELSPLARRFGEGTLAVVHAVGSDDQTRSHFEAQDRMEHGGPSGRAVGSGWLARLTRALGGARGGLAAVALGTSTPEALRGAASVSVFESAQEHRIGADDAYVSVLADLYRGTDALGAAGRDALATLERLRTLPGTPSTAGYPEARFGERLAELARLIRARVGVRAACVDLDGWDTHYVQAVGFAGRVRTLAAGLDAFARDLGDEMGRVTIVVMTEFGRRAYENGSLGTDHGRASVMFVLGAGVRGGRVHGRWPGLSERTLEPPGDLAVTTDYRQVLAELVEARFPAVDREHVLARVPPARLGVFG